MKKSWKTTAAGVAALVGAVGIAIAALFDGDPSTTADWDSILIALTALGIGIPVWLQGVFSRDKDVSSEEQTAK